MNLLTEKLGSVWLLLKSVPKHTKTRVVNIGIETRYTISSILQSRKELGNSLLLSQKKKKKKKA